jgi:hypothetical protein
MGLKRVDPVGDRLTAANVEIEVIIPWSDAMTTSNAIRLTSLSACAG